MHNRIGPVVLFLTTACMLIFASACKETGQDVKVQINLSLTGGSGGGTGGSSRDTTLTVTGKMSDGVIKVDLPVKCPRDRKLYQLELTPEYDYKTTRMQRYVKMSSDTGGSSPDTLYYKSPKDGKDDDRD